jgi:hypothetical protein
MKNIKTYEGFFDFLKKKKKSTEPIYLDDIKECLLDLTEDPRFNNSLDGRVGGIFTDQDVVFKISRGLSLTHDFEDIMNDQLGLPNYIKGNMMVVKFNYTTSSIHNNEINFDELKRLLDICSSKLKTYDCVTSFYLAYGYDEGRSDDKEYKNTEKLFKEIISVDRTPNITIKITAPSEIKL